MEKGWPRSFILFKANPKQKSHKCFDFLYKSLDLSCIFKVWFHIRPCPLVTNINRVIEFTFDIRSSNNICRNRFGVYKLFWHLLTIVPLLILSVIMRVSLWQIKQTKGFPKLKLIRPNFYIFTNILSGGCPANLPSALSYVLFSQEKIFWS